MRWIQYLLPYLKIVLCLSQVQMLLIIAYLSMHETLSPYVLFYFFLVSLVSFLLGNQFGNHFVSKWAKEKTDRDLKYKVSTGFLRCVDKKDANYKNYNFIKSSNVSLMFSTFSFVNPEKK